MTSAVSHEVPQRPRSRIDPNAVERNCALGWTAYINGPCTKSWVLGGLAQAPAVRRPRRGRQEPTVGLPVTPAASGGLWDPLQTK